MDRLAFAAAAAHQAPADRYQDDGSFCFPLSASRFLANACFRLLPSFPDGISLPDLPGGPGRVDNQT